MEKSQPSKEFWSWFVAFRNPKDIAQLHSSYLAAEILLFLCFFLTTKHAIRSGGRHLYLWLGSLIFGIAMENISYLVPEADIFWHAQSTVMFVGQRLPLHIIFLYPTYLYTASFAVSCLNLKSWAEPFAMCLATILLDFPYEILAVKLLWWTWHDTDPNIANRFYWVPWVNFYFWAAFGSSFIMVLRGLQTLIPAKINSKSIKFFLEFLCSSLAGLLAIPCGVLQFVLGYHVLHDMYEVPTNVCVCIFLATFGVITWSCGKDREKEKKANKSDPWSRSYELVILITIYYLVLVATVIFVRPEEIQSIGLHEPIGDCNTSIPLRTPIGMVSQRRRYLCLEGFDKGYYDFHCVFGLSKAWPSNTWYSICGTAFENHAEYIILILSSSLVAYFVFIQMLMKGENYNPKASKHVGAKQKLK